MMTISESWERILHWYNKNVPHESDAFLKLADGATEREIIDFESEIGMGLPDDFRESLLLHDGSQGRQDLVDFGNVLSIKEILSEWNMYRTWNQDHGWGNEAPYDWTSSDLNTGYIKPISWTPQRIPVTEDGGQTHIIIDLDPAEKGSYGQILYYGISEGPGSVLAPSWSEWLISIGDDLENGKYVYEDDTVTTR